MGVGRSLVEHKSGHRAAQNLFLFLLNCKVERAESPEPRALASQSRAVALAGCRVLAGQLRSG
jgi:hypothetical protein